MITSNSRVSSNFYKAVSPLSCELSQNAQKFYFSSHKHAVKNGGPYILKPRLNTALSISTNFYAPNNLILGLFYKFHKYME